MKLNNPSNRRFCDKGDIFYWEEEQKYLFCSSYYKSATMHYVFQWSDEHRLKQLMLVGSKTIIFMMNSISSRIHFTRSELDAYWRDKSIRNLDPAEEAKLFLLGFKF